MNGQYQIRETIKNYYGRVLSGTKDLKTGACCSLEAHPPHHLEILAQIDEEIINRFYGCGSPIPAAIEGCTVLDLGCGTGRDVYLASRLVGQDGYVVGVDMTGEQLDVAVRHRDAQMARFGYSRANVEFHHGQIEDLASFGIADESVDLVISNCVINLSPEKERVFSEIFRVLRPGGELYFSDIFTGRRIPSELSADPILIGECLGGALYLEDFRRMLQRLGCADYRVISRQPVNLENPAVEARTGMIDFHSVTVRAFKLAGLEDICEDYGQTATYLGTIPDMPNFFSLDDHHTFETGKAMLVCGNTATMLGETRFARHFCVAGDRSRHFGPFSCGPSPAEAKSSSASCC